MAGRNLVVSTGTGSGKTESFLIPIINHLIAEHAEGRLGPVCVLLFLPDERPQRPAQAAASTAGRRFRITFGRYTGETAETSPAPRRSSFKPTREPPDYPMVLSRQEMRSARRICFLTNYAMLEYLC